MGSGKRASMREGPLAALFRKTETEGLEPPARSAAEQAAAAAATEPRPSAPSPTPQERLRHAFSSDVPGEHDGPAGRRPGASRRRAGDYQWSSARDDRVGQPQLRVVGVGGGGVNAVNRMIEAEVGGVEFIAVNTDAQSLQQSRSAHDAADRRRHHARARLRVGPRSRPAGRDGGLRPHEGLLKGSDMVFITAGEGGGTGTGAAPIVARIARGARRADRGHRHQAVRLRGLAPAAGGRAGHPGAAPTRSTR